MRLTNAVLALVAAIAWPSTVAWAQAGGGVQALASADTNGDGAVSRDEARALRAAAFGALDTDQDGFVSAEERAAAVERRGGQSLQRADANSDGRISRAEFTSQPMRMFDRFDANSNDVLEPGEIEAMRNAAQRFGG